MLESWWEHPFTIPLAFGAGAVACILAERRWARAPSPTLRPAWRTDLALVVLNGLVVERLAAAVAGWIALGFSRAWTPDALAVLEGTPLWLQLPLLLLLADLIFYWLHWAFHRVPALWALHKVHHSSEHLDWLVSSRSHSLDFATGYVANALLLGPLGFSSQAFAIAALFDMLNGMWTHANLPVRLRGFRHLVVTPEFHRWHHSVRDEAQGSNLAMVFPLWDHLFGTYYYPRDERPEPFGLTRDKELARLGLLRLLARPLRDLARGT